MFPHYKVDLGCLVMFPVWFTQEGSTEGSNRQQLLKNLAKKTEGTMYVHMRA